LFYYIIIRKKDSVYRNNFYIKAFDMSVVCITLLRSCLNTLGIGIHILLVHNLELMSGGRYRKLQEDK